MGIRFLCPNGHKLNVKSFLAGKRAICPQCGAKVLVPDVRESPTADMPLSAAGMARNPLGGPAEFASPSLQDTASPSVIIAIAESEVATPSVQGFDDVELQPNAAGIPESAVLAPPLLMATTEPVIASPEAKHELRRARTRHTQFVISIVLLILVIVLAMVLIWVLRRNGGEPASEPAKTVRMYERATPVRIVANSHRVFEGT
jgi:hypothetical protein